MIIASKHLRVIRTGFAIFTAINSAKRTCKPHLHRRLLCG